MESLTVQNISIDFSSPEQMIILVVGFLVGIILGVLISFWVASSKSKKMAEESARQRAELIEQSESLTLQIHQLQVEQSSDRTQLRQLETLQHSLTEKQTELNQVQNDNAILKTQMKAEQTRYEEQLAIVSQAKEQLTKEFENIANKIFEKKQQQFTQSSQSTLDVTLNPLKEQIKEFKKQVEDAYHKENAERNKLVGQITELQKQAQRIGEDAVNLATALKGSNKTQGNWGEVILERLLEESGLHKGREYETQVSLKDEDGNRRNPDVIIRLPENKDIVIDAKVSLLHYESFCNEEDDTRQKNALKNHIASIRTHIDGLSKKNYDNLESIRSLDFVFIFVPVEAAFMLAMQHDPSLFNYAFDKHIVLVSPTTLLATLRTVENIWRYEKQNKNAEKIASMAGSLHDQFALVTESLDDLGQHIVRTQTAFDSTQKRLKTGRGNLYKRIQDLEKLGAKTKRSLRKIDDDTLDLVEIDDSASKNIKAEPSMSSENTVKGLQLDTLSADE
ncbi:MAG: DNA recombination protein RmuC [Cellvibrionaceae bacterium]